MSGLEHFMQNLGLMWAYGISAVVFLIVTLKTLDWMTPKIDLEKELVENKNMAVAVPVAAFILAVSAIIVAVIVT